MTTAEQWQRAKDVLDEALDMDTEARPAFIQEACGGDGELLAEVEALLRLDDETELSGFIDRPMFTLHQGEAEASPLGRVVGRYRLVEEIGRGGMGTVYLAERADEEVEHRVALKILKRGLDTDEIVDRFRRERQIVARLNHPHIANFLDAGTTDDGLPYFVLEHVDGRPIDRYCDEENLDVEERLELFLTVCDAVRFAHQNLVVHRDLKPGNILVMEDGSPKLLDFGIAKILSPDGDLGDVTRADVRFFTRDFASPEQIRNLPITTATDVYSLGVLLYALLAGERPFHRDTTDEERTDGLPKMPSQAAPADLREILSGDLDHIVLQALHPDPERRYGSVEQLADDVRRYLDGLPVKASPDSALYRAKKFVRRHRVAVATVTGFVVLLMIFGAVTTVLLNRSIRDQRRAETAREEADTVAGLLTSTLAEARPDRAQGQEPTVQEALDRGVPKILEAISDSNFTLKSRMLDQMGLVYSTLGNHEKAEELFQQAYELRQEHDVPPALIAESLVNLATAYRGLGKRQATEARLRGAIEIYEGLLPEHHEEYHEVQNNLAVLLMGTQRLDEAEQILRDLLHSGQGLKASGPRSKATTLHNLGLVLQKQGQYAEAETLLHEALQLRRQHYEDPNSRIATTLNVLAATLEEVGKVGQARALYEEAYKMRRELYPNGHRDVAGVLNNLALIALHEDELESAEAYLREGIAVLEAIEDPHPWYHAWLLHNLAEVLAAQDKLNAAEELGRQALEALRDSARPWQIADAESVLALILIRQGVYREAEALLQRAYPVLANRDRDDRYRRKALDHLVALYEAWGRPEQAELYRQIRDGSAGDGVPNVPSMQPAESMTAPFELDLL